MSTTAATATPSDTLCIPDERSLPDGPFTALRYHFGMLLGVEDFSTEQRYHRGKMRLHNSWLHRAGIVWGLDVRTDLTKNELIVLPGLANDPTGRELHLDVRCCLDIGQWYDQNKDDVETRQVGDSADIQFDGHVELVFCSCGTRPVPAMSTPCEGANVDTAYSRTFETVAIRFLPGLAPVGAPPYPRLRMLFGIDDGAAQELQQADLDEIAQARSDVAHSGTWSQTFLEKFRHFADEDATEMEPAIPDDGTATVYPGLDAAGVVLANVKDITLAGAEGGWTVTAATVDRTPRRILVATETIEELLCGDLRGGAAAGPQVESIAIDGPGKTIQLKLDKAVDPASVSKASFSITYLHSDGWKTIGQSSDPAVSGDGTEIDLATDTDPGNDVLRFIAYGTGPTPILGVDHVPLAGVVSGPPGTEDDGRDYVHTTVLTNTNP